MGAPVVVVEYDPQWPRLFEQEKAALLTALGDRLVAIEHMGSTAIPGLSAKPIIDIIAALRSLDEVPACLEPLRGLGYHYVPEFEALIPERRFFRKGPPEKRTHHLHLFAEGEFGERHERLFRDYVRAHPEAAQEYGRLKRELAAQYGADREGYTNAKTDFVQHIIALARAEKDKRGG
jgi:GrpB-like predicted nucleotidyltransferase (UPF0157 family)